MCPSNSTEHLGVALCLSAEQMLVNGYKGMRRRAEGCWCYLPERVQRSDSLSSGAMGAKNKPQPE